MPNRAPTPKELESLRQDLLLARSAITGDISQLAREALGDREQVPGEVREEYDDLSSQEFNLELLQHDEETLRLIEEALERIEDGIYGRCLACEGWIGKERLRAVPYAENCIGCQRELEREAS